MRQTATYEETFRELLEVKSRSGDELVCLCPFHNDSTPSFWANTVKGLWVCYSCGVGGGMKKLLRHFGRDTVAAPQVGGTRQHLLDTLAAIEADYLEVEAEIAARRCSCHKVYQRFIDSSVRTIDEKNRGVYFNTTSVSPVVSSSDLSSGSSPGRCPVCSLPLVLPESFLKRFTTSSSSKTFISYLGKRDISYVSGSSSTSSVSLNSLGSSSSTPVDGKPSACARGESVSSAERFELGWNALTSAVTLPYRHHYGPLLGVVERRLTGRPKYMYPRKFPRTETLYGSWLIPGAATTEVVLCEGPFDAIKVWQAGIPAVSMWGSQLHEKQVQLLYSLGMRSVVLFTDRDAAGRSAALSAAGKLASFGFLVRQVRYPATYPGEYSDPGSLPEVLIRARVRRAKWVW
jgi:DNA primase